LWWFFGSGYALYAMANNEITRNSVLLPDGEAKHVKRTTRRSNKALSTSRKRAGKQPVSVITREGKTTLRQFDGRRFVRLNEVKGKTVGWVELYTAGPDGHAITLRFQDQTGLHLELIPGFIVKPEYFNSKNGNYHVVKTWPEVKSER
jgi:hypothetical protein